MFLIYSLFTVPVVTDRSVEPFSFIWKMVDMEEKDSEQWKSLILFHYEGTRLEVNGSNKNFQRNL